MAESNSKNAEKIHSSPLQCDEYRNKNYILELCESPEGKK